MTFNGKVAPSTFPPLTAELSNPLNTSPTPPKDPLTSKVQEIAASKISPEDKQELEEMKAYVVAYQNDRTQIVSFEAYKVSKATELYQEFLGKPINTKDPKLQQAADAVLAAQEHLMKIRKADCETFIQDLLPLPQMELLKKFQHPTYLPQGHRYKIAFTLYCEGVEHLVVSVSNYIDCNTIIEHAKFLEEKFNYALKKSNFPKDEVDKVQASTVQYAALHLAIKIAAECKLPVVKEDIELHLQDFHFKNPQFKSPLYMMKLHQFMMQILDNQLSYSHLQRWMWGREKFERGDLSGIPPKTSLEEYTRIMLTSRIFAVEQEIKATQAAIEKFMQLIQQYAKLLKVLTGLENETPKDPLGISQIRDTLKDLLDHDDYLKRDELYDVLLKKINTFLDEVFDLYTVLLNIDPLFETFYVSANPEEPLKVKKTKRPLSPNTIERLKKGVDTVVLDIQSINAQKIACKNVIEMMILNNKLTIANLIKKQNVDLIEILLKS